MSPADSNKLREQILTHLRHLRGAGIEWLPVAPPLLAVPRETSSGASERAASADSMFDIADETRASDGLPL